jgi:SAM-dependent methyltransferase
VNLGSQNMDASQVRDGSTGFNRRQKVERVTAIYRESFAAGYGSLYVQPWRRKHELNLHNLARILDALPIAQPSWLDLACGQAWHFARFGGRARMCGLDLSPAQLARARLRTRQVTIESGRAAKAARRLRLSAAVRAIVSFRVLSAPTGAFVCCLRGYGRGPFLYGSFDLVTMFWAGYR